MKGSIRILGLLFTAFVLASTAVAGDAIKASVEAPTTTPTPVVMVNGAGYTPGTYAIGTIRLVYTVIGYAFTTGEFATFQLGLENTSGYKGGAATIYPVDLNLEQVGSGLVLTPETATFSIESVNWRASTSVKISIPPGVSNDDGTVLVGNLQLSTSPPGNHLDTVTTVQVQIKLAYPSSSCLRMYDFVTAEDLTALTGPISVNVSKDGSKIRSTQPGQLSDNVLVVNTCAQAQAFDLKVELDPAFQVHPNGNPGNAVFTFVTEGAAAPTAATIQSLAPTPGTAQAQALCLPAILLEPQETLLETVHMAIDTSVNPSLLTPDAFQFTAGLYVASPGTACGAGAPNPLASPNPVSVALAYERK